MQIFELLTTKDAEVTPERSKIHLATWNGTENPLEVYFAGDFNDWQQWQTKKNFEREFVVSLIALPERNQWLLAGVFRALGNKRIEDNGLYQYQLESLSQFDEFAGRLVVEFSRTMRQSYLNAESWYERILLSEIRREKLSIGEFPGYRKVDLSRAELEVVVSHSLESWRTALSNVSGIYLISDRSSGKLYVGSASGEGGIWQRWTQYVSTGHGGNVELRALIKDGGLERVQPFRYSVLEITDIHASEDDVLTRESHWKNILMSRDYGLNAN